MVCLHNRQQILIDCSALAEDVLPLLAGDAYFD